MDPGLYLEQHTRVFHLSKRTWRLKHEKESSEVNNARARVDLEKLTEEALSPEDKNSGSYLDLTLDPGSAPYVFTADGFIGL